jgi:competence protein ComEC
VARTPSIDPEFGQLAETLKQVGVSVETIGAGDVMRIGNVAFEVLWPLPTSNANAASHNNDSLVLRVRMGERSFLFTGDVEKEAEARVIKEGVDLRSDVVKVAHHGSRTSSTEAFVSATRPSLAVISVGRTSLFGHPHREVVERWRASGAEVLTTGQKGTISIVTDGRALNVSTFVRD